MAEYAWLQAKLNLLLFTPGAQELLTERKCRLFAAACSRRIWRYIPDVSKKIIEALEQLADGKITDAKWKAICDAHAEEASQLPEISSVVQSYAVSVIGTCIEDGGLRLVSTTATYCQATVRYDSPSEKAHKREQEEERAQCDLLRDLLPNPISPVTFSPEWRTDTAVSLARQMYDARDFSAMPILADALQDAGCDHPDILDHCRGPGPHVRGCWVVDLVLGKE